MRVSGLVGDDDAMVRGVRLFWRRLSIVLIVKGPLDSVSPKKLVSRRCVQVVNDGWWKEGTGGSGGINEERERQLRKYSCLVVSA
jgi:hypothetical protein